MRVWDAVAEILRREGVEQLCTFPSTPLIDACAAIDIRPVICRQERVGVGIADGFARTTGGRRPAVFAMQSGPGSENAFAGIATAHADSSPVLLLPMGLPRDRSQLFPNFDSRLGFAAVTKNYERLAGAQFAVEAMGRAFALLRSGRPGPVMLEIPLDVGGEEVEGVDGYRPVHGTAGSGDPTAVDAAAGALLAAERPVIYAGQGVLYADASDELRELAELIEAPVATSIGGKSCFPEDHPLALGSASVTLSDPARDFIRDADTILGVGCSLTKGATLSINVPPGKVLIHTTNDPRDIGKSYFVDHPIVGDAKLVLGQFVEAVRDRIKTRPRPATGVAARIAETKRSWLERWLPKLTSDEVPLSAYRVIWDFMHAVDPAETIVTHDAGSPRDQLMPFYMATRPHGYLGWGKSHGLGAGLGFILGAKLAAPDKLCVHFMGDAAFGMTGTDLETAVRCGLPTLSMVFRNSTMAIEYATLTTSHEKYRSRDLGGEYCEVAAALGLHAERVRNPAEISPAIQRARQSTRDGRAALIEFITSDEIAFSNYRGLN